MSRENRDKAYRIFQQRGLIPNDGQRYCLHHKDWTLKFIDPDRYKEWRVDDLEVMTISEHSKYHCYLFHSGKYHKLLAEIYEIDDNKEYEERYY